MRRKKTIDAEEKRWVSRCDIKEVSEDERLTETVREFQSTGPMY